MEYKMNYTVRDNEFSNQKIKIRSILNLFQTSATIHANKLGLSFDEIYNKGYYWVLLKTKFEVYGDILPNEEIILYTYPKVSGKIDFDRDHIIYDKNGNVLIKACTKFVLVDILTRKIVRSNNITYPGKHIESSNFDGFDKLRVMDTNLKLLGTYQVKASDIDENNHMNNVSYANVIDDLYKRDKKIKNFQIDYFHLYH